MKLVTYSRRGEARGGILVDAERILDLAESFALVEREAGRAHAHGDVTAKYGSGVLGFVQNARIARPAADALVARAVKDEVPQTLFVSSKGAQLHAPIPRPPSMRDGYAFRQHVETARKNRGLEMIPEFDMFPVFYFTNHGSVIGPGELRVRKQHMDRLDFELEAAIVVGQETRDLTAHNADEAIFGLTIMNDFSARALQMEEMKLSLGPAKGKDFATGLGPWLVTLDELSANTKKTDRGNVFDLGMRASVNGVRVSNGNVKDMNFTFAQILERVSYGVTVYPGDVIGSGTCGTGCFLELNGSKLTDNQWLRDGDTVALEIDMLGKLEHKVVLFEPA